MRAVSASRSSSRNSPSFPISTSRRTSFLGASFAAACRVSSTARGSMREARRVLDMIGFDIDPRTPVHTLGVAQQQMVEIAKALSQDARILVMDEPTAALSDRETERLFAIIRRLQAERRRDRLHLAPAAEVFALGDRITVLRDGRKIASVLPAETAPDDLVRLMVGREVDTHLSRASTARTRASCCSTSKVSRPTTGSRTSASRSAPARSSACAAWSARAAPRSRARSSARTASRRARSASWARASPAVRTTSARRGHGAHSGEPQAAGAGADPFGRRQHRARKPATGCFPPGVPAGPAAKAARAERSSNCASRRRRPHRPVAVLSGGNQQKVVVGKWLAAGCARVHLRRADARHRRRRQGRDLPLDRRAGAEGRRRC